MNVNIEASPYIDTLYKSTPLRITLDSGCTGNMVSSAVAERLNLTMKKNSRSTLKADKQSNLNISKKTSFTVTRDSHKLQCHALVAKNLGEQQ